MAFGKTTFIKNKFFKKSVFVENLEKTILTKLAHLMKTFDKQPPGTECF